MIDFVFSLRFLLILIGLALLGGIYVVGSAKSRRNKRIRFEPRQRFEPARHRNREEEEPLDPALVIDADDLPAIAADPLLMPAEESVADLPVITKDGDTDGDAVRTNDQLELNLDSEQAEAAISGAAPEETIVALYIKPPSGHEFAGSAIVSAMNQVGLHFGDMNIFHHYGAGELQTDTPLFSVANIVEPGTFDLSAIDHFSSPGLAMFLRLPCQLDGAVAFELFLNSAQRLSEALTGELYGEPNRLLDSAKIAHLRESAIRFTTIATA